MTRLTDLEPRWIGGTQHGGPDHERHGMGVSFICPACKSHRLTIHFQNPIDGLKPTRTKVHADGTEFEEPEGFKWARFGETFDALTLTPSIDAKCWHGHITNGTVLNAGQSE